MKVTRATLDLKAMLARKDKVVSTLTGGVDGLFKKNKITRVLGKGRIVGPGRVEVEGEDAGELQAKAILIATGSVPSGLPGVELDGDRVGTSTEALSWGQVPKRLVVIGAGYIGLELGAVWRRLGAEVTVLEYLDRILPGMDAGLAKEALKLFTKQGMKFELGCRVTGAKAAGKTAKVEIEGKDTIEAERVLVAVGRRPFTEGLGLETVGIELDERGRIPVDGHFKTSAEGGVCDRGCDCGADAGAQGGGRRGGVRGDAGGEGGARGLPLDPGGVLHGA